MVVSCSMDSSNSMVGILPESIDLPHILWRYVQWRWRVEMFSNQLLLKTKIHSTFCLFLKTYGLDQMKLSRLRQAEHETV